MFAFKETDPWTIVSARTKCAGSEVYITPPSQHKMGISIEECAYSCKGISSMFAFGTNDYGYESCWDDKCMCICETAASVDGTCEKIGHHGYRLFKYTYNGKNLALNTMTYNL